MEKNLVFWTKVGFNAIGQKTKKTGEPIMLGNWGTFVSFVLNPDEGENKTPTFYSYFIKISTIEKIKDNKDIDLRGKAGFGWLLIKIDGNNKLEVLDFEPIIKGATHPDNKNKKKSFEENQKDELEKEASASEKNFMELEKKVELRDEDLPF